ALSLVLLDHMPDKAHATQLKEEFLRALMVGTLASELSPVSREAEEIFLSAMFQNLGRLMVEFYFPDEARQIRASNEANAAQRVLGIGFEALGLGVAKVWGLPDTLQRAMTCPQGELPGKAVGGVERQRWIGRMAAEATDLLLQGEDGHSGGKLESMAQRYGRALGVDGKQLREAAEQSRQRLAQLAQAMQIGLGQEARARRLLACTSSSLADADSLAQHSLKAHAGTTAAVTAPGTTPASAVAAAQPQAPAVNVAELLASGVQDITNHMVADGFKLNEVLRMILETMYRALGFRRIVFCLRDARTDSLTGRFGLGEGATEVAATMRVALKAPAGKGPDLFTAVCLKGVDTLITDATTASIAARLPSWFAQHVGAPSFLLLPLMLKGAPLGLIYADQSVRGGITLGEKELALLRTLRNQGVMAFKQAS
ncbi:MAG: HDOD domain-containing protein, partial [Burkholderiaceae bacterium]